MLTFQARPQLPSTLSLLNLGSAPRPTLAPTELPLERQRGLLSPSPRRDLVPLIPTHLPAPRLPSAVCPPPLQLRSRHSDPSPRIRPRRRSPSGSFSFPSWYSSSFHSAGPPGTRSPASLLHCRPVPAPSPNSAPLPLPQRQAPSPESRCRPES